MKFRLLMTTIAALFLVVPPAIAQQARLSADTVVTGDLVTLEVSYRNTRSSMFKLDTGPLETDFEVVDIEPSMKMDRQAGSYVNIMHWRVLLAPKRSGTITIPSLQIREATTPQLQLTVTEKNPWEQFQEDVRLEISVDKSSPRVGEQFIVTMRFVSNRPVISGYLRDPEVSGATRLGLGRDQFYPQESDGIAYQVLERSIAFFAGSAGPLRIKPAEYRGSLRAIPSISGLADTRQFRRFSDPITLQIRPLPAGTNSSDWHPLDNATLSQQWQIPDDPLKPGDQILRQVVLKTTGLPPEKFDAGLFQLEVDGADSFLDQPKQSLSTDHGKINAEFLQDQLFIITREGPISLPELSFNYWDTGLDQPATIGLPGTLIDVPPLPSKPPLYPTRMPVSTTLLVIAIALAGCLIVARLVIQWLITVKNSRLTGYQPSRLKSACQHNDAAEAARQMLAWGRARNLLNHVGGLRSLAMAVTSEALHSQLMELDAAIYGARQQPWQGKHLWSALNQYRLPKSLQTISRMSLPPLYPPSSYRSTGIAKY